MDRSDLNRREFTKLALAALGGALAGAGVVHAAKDDDEDKKDKKEKKPKKKDPKKPLLLQEPHICRGLNTCKNQGKGGKNACFGQGNCATAPAHTCTGDNECAGLGGCGKTPGENACKGKGECGVPLSSKAWTRARARFEAAAKKAKKKVGKAPPPKKKTED
jgi:hypothetical protein